MRPREAQHYGIGRAIDTKGRSKEMDSIVHKEEIIYIFLFIF